MQSKCVIVSGLLLWYGTTLLHLNGMDPESQKIPNQSYSRSSSHNTLQVNPEESTTPEESSPLSSSIASESIENVPTPETESSSSINNYAPNPVTIEPESPPLRDGSNSTPQTPSSLANLFIEQNNSGLQSPFFSERSESEEPLSTLGSSDSESSNRETKNEIKGLKKENQRLKQQNEDLANTAYSANKDYETLATSIANEKTYYNISTILTYLNYYKNGKLHKLNIQIFSEKDDITIPDLYTFEDASKARLAIGSLIGTIIGGFTTCGLMSIDRVATHIPNDYKPYSIATGATVGGAAGYTFAKRYCKALEPAKVTNDQVCMQTILNHEKHTISHELSLSSSSPCKE